MEEERFQKVFAARDKLETELEVYQELLDEIVERRVRRVKVEKLIRSCQRDFQNAFEENEDINNFSEETKKSENLVKKINNFLQKALSFS